MKPANLLFILSDQHNRDVSGCYGHKQVETPNLDALAARGVRFDNAYTNCPICVPARASLATGRYVHEIGYWDNAFPYEGRVRGWGHRLVQAGHKVDSIGKLHFRSTDDDVGFSNSLIPLNVVAATGDVMGSIRSDSPVRAGARTGITSAGPGESTYLSYDSYIADRSCEWLETAAGQQGNAEQKPWVLFASFVCPHPPYIAPPEIFAKYPLSEIELPLQNHPDERPTHPALAELRRVMQYDHPFTEEEIRRVTAAYYGTCTYLDQQIGRVLDTLEATGLADSTRVIYTSDHGESLGRRGLWGKFTMYEESAAIPFIVAGPEVPRNQSSSSPISLVDCYQTILDAVGVELEDEERSLPGTSIWPLAAGQQLDRPILSEYHAVGSTSGSFMLRHGKYKYIHYVGQSPQLFDLETDPDELNDLSSDNQFRDALAECESVLRGIVDPELVDSKAKADQQALVDQHGGTEAILKRGTFTNSPVPGEVPTFHKSS
jgi:choline-sulfatase